MGLMALTIDDVGPAQWKLLVLIHGVKMALFILQVVLRHAGAWRRIPVCCARAPYPTSTTTNVGTTATSAFAWWRSPPRLVRSPKKGEPAVSAVPWSSVSIGTVTWKALTRSCVGCRGGPSTQRWQLWEQSVEAQLVVSVHRESDYKTPYRKTNKTQKKCNP